LHVQLTDDLRWETNGYIWYGDGGSGFGTTEQEGYSVVDGYLVGTAYGNAKGSENEILLYEYEHTLTSRPGFTSKLVYDYNNFTFMGGVWYEHASQKQNEPFAALRFRSKATATRSIPSASRLTSKPPAASWTTR
jgi:hypothetical protein